MGGAEGAFWGGWGGVQLRPRPVVNRADNKLDY